MSSNMWEIDLLSYIVLPRKWMFLLYRKKTICYLYKIFYNSMKELTIKKASFSAYLTAISKGLESCDSPSPKVITI